MHEQWIQVLLSDFSSVWERYVSTGQVMVVQRVVTSISTVLRAVIETAPLHMVDVGVAWVWLSAFFRILQKSQTIFATITGSPTAGAHNEKERLT